MNLFDLYAKISIDTGEYEAGINSAVSKGNKATQAIKASTIAMGNLMAKGIEAGAKALVNLGKTGLEYNSQMESYTSNFKVMLGSTEEAANKVEELKKLAASTPFGMGDLADATQTLLAFQVPAENTTSILSMLGDVALGDSAKLSSLATVFGQISSAGKLTGQDLMQFINAGFNPLNYIAERTGESMEELRERMSAGAIGVDEVTQAFVDATSEGGQFYKGMQEASQTTQGLISTLQDNAQALIGKVFTPISEGLVSDVLPAAVEGIDKLTAAFEENGIEGMAEAGGEIVGSLVARLAVGLIEGIPKVLASIPDVVAAMIRGFSEHIPEFKEIGSNLLEGLWNGLADKVAWLKRQVSGVVDTIKSWFTGADGFDTHSPSKWFEQVGTYMMQGLAIGMENSKGEVMETAEGIVSEVKNRFSNLYDILTTRQDVGDLQYELWEKTDGKNASDTEKYAKRLELLNAQQKDQVSIVEAAQAAYSSIVEQYGENSQESYNYQKKLLEEQIRYQELVDSINEVIEAERQLSGYRSSSLSGSSEIPFSKSALGVISAVGMNNAVTAPIYLTSKLVLDNGVELARNTLQDFISVALANGTPIANPSTG